MQLHISDTQKLVTIDFGLWLIPIIRAKINSSIKKYNFNQLDNFLNSTDTLTRLYEGKYFTTNIVLFASKNLVCSGSDGDIIIKFNTNTFVPGFNSFKLLSAIKLINYGNLEVKGCPLFTSVLNEVAENISDYVNQYYLF